MFQDKFFFVIYDIIDDDVQLIGVGLGCNGIIDVFIVLFKDELDNVLEVLWWCIGEWQFNILIMILYNEDGLEVLYLGCMFWYESVE